MGSLGIIGFSVYLLHITLSQLQILSESSVIAPYIYNDAIPAYIPGNGVLEGRGCEGVLCLPPL